MSSESKLPVSQTCSQSHEEVHHDHDDGDAPQHDVKQSQTNSSSSQQNNQDDTMTRRARKRVTTLINHLLTQYGPT